MYKTIQYLPLVYLAMLLESRRHKSQSASVSVSLFTLLFVDDVTARAVLVTSLPYFHGCQRHNWGRRGGGTVSAKKIKLVDCVCSSYGPAIIIILA